MALVIQFSNGVAVSSHGEYRVIEKTDGCYVVGRGFCLAVIDRSEGERLIADLNAGRIAPDDV